VEDEGVDGGEHPSEERGVCHGWERVAMGG
jgi:hypothetical protein